MLPRRLHHVVVALSTLVGPLAAVAHAEITGSVTTAPALAAAPAIGLPLLALLAVALTGGGAYVLRRRGGGAMAKVAFVAMLTALAGLAYAAVPNMITIEDAKCGMEVETPFNPLIQFTLVNGCPNAIRILDFQTNCFDPPGPAPCRKGQVLASGDSCSLPRCL